jgi:hypothetical protein
VTPNEEQAARVVRRGHQIFQAALRMEAGDTYRGSGGAEALLYLVDATARIVGLAEKPRLAIETVVRLLDAIKEDWIAKQRSGEGLAFASVGQLVADLALEMAIGQDEDTEIGTAAASALDRLASAIVCVAARNKNPRQIIEHVVQRLDATDVEAARRAQLK